jgi:hypothetical protein
MEKAVRTILVYSLRPTPKTGAFPLSIRIIAESTSGEG